MIDARSREECERYGGEWVDGYIKIGHGRRENVYVDAYCRKPRKGSHHYQERLKIFEGYDIPGGRRR